MTVFTKSTGLALSAAILAAASLASAAPPAAAPSALVETAGQSIVFQPGGIVQPLPQATRIESERDAARLKSAQGITLQWISWEERGRVSVSPNANGVWRLSGSQLDQSGGGLRVEGTITEIGPDYFLLDGRIEIAGTPDANRECDARKVWRFEVTQNRTYYRLREFEWCDNLTDYIDIYFSPSLR